VGRADLAAVDEVTEVGVESRPQLGAEGLVLGGVPEVHGRKLTLTSSTVRAVDFTFGEDQEALRTTARAFLAAEAAGPKLRAMIDGGEGPAAVEALWARTVALGWPGLLVPTAHGGAEAGMLEATVLCEEMGALPLPGPWLAGPPGRRRT